MSLSSQNSAAPVCPANDPDPSPGAEEDAVRATLQELYREYRSSLVRQITRKTGCRELALELANEAFLRLMQVPPGKLGTIERPEAYLRRVAANLVSSWGRTKALKERSLFSLEMVSERQFDQVSALESRDMLRRLEDAVGKLKPKTREIFLARRIHGLSYAEIAIRTGLGVKGVEKQMSKAIAKIDRLLDRD